MNGTPEQPAENAWIPAPRVGLSAPPPMAWEYDAPAARRSTGKRLAMLFGMLAAYLAATTAVFLALTWSIHPDDYATTAEYDAALNVGCLGTWALSLPLTLGVFAYLTPKVGYRRRDVLFLFVPVYSYVFCVKVLWRATALPDRYWTPRLEDTALEPDADAAPEADIWARV